MAEGHTLLGVSTRQDCAGGQHTTRLCWGSAQDKTLLGVSTQQGCVGGQHKTRLCWGSAHNKAVLGVSTRQGCAGGQHTTRLCWGSAQDKAVLGVSTQQGCVGGQHKTRLCWGSTQDKAVFGKRLALIVGWDSYVKDSLNSACVATGLFKMTPSEMEDSRRKFCSGYLRAQESPHALHPVRRSGRELSGTVFTHSL